MPSRAERGHLARPPGEAPGAAPRTRRSPRLTGAALAAALVLAGCAALHPPPAAEPAVDVAALGGKPGAVEWPSDAWWHRYGDAQLDALVAEGLAGSPSLAAARARVARAKAAADVAHAALLPRVGGSADVNYQRFSENYIFPPPLAGNWDTDNRLALGLDYEFDFWNKNGAALQAALSQAQASAADAAATRVVLTTGIARAYFELQRLFAQREVSRAAIAQREEVVRLTRDRFGAGLDTKVEVEQAEAALETVNTELAQYDVAIANARHEVAALAGAGPDRGERIEARAAHHGPATRTPVAVPLDLVSRRPEIVASRWRVEAAGHDIDVARAMFYPNIDLAALIGLNSIGLSRLFEMGSIVAGIAPAIHLPIFEGGRLEANLSGREAERDLAISAYNQAVIDAVHDVADALASVDGLGHVAAAQAKARAATSRAYELAVIRYRAGLGNYLTVLTAQTQQLIQDRLDADLTARAFLLDVNLARALGGGFDDLRLPVTASAASAGASPR
jgi:NodT family efflux transporter outer membrane factor (OMF) lipoprotein